MCIPILVQVLVTLVIILWYMHIPTESHCSLQQLYTGSLYTPVTLPTSYLQTLVHFEDKLLYSFSLHRKKQDDYAKLHYGMFGILYYQIFLACTQYNTLW